MNLADPSMALLAAAGGDTVKLFDVSVDSGDPCTLTYSPSPDFQINSVKWNHTNLVVASAGDDKRISLWRKNGQSMGTIPVSGADSGDGIEESITTISFSNKGSRYMCSGGTGQVVRIWDLQRKRCIKWLSGHTDTITGAMYNCKDEYLASISLKGDLILHNLASGARAAELKDPYKQVLRMLDYSRISRHLLVTAGDDGSVHLWDTTGRSLKASWLKQHSAPTAGVCFSPSNDKIIASVGLDKKLYTFDSGAKRPSFCISYEAPFSSLALRDDGWILAAGTSNGRVVFYDIRGKPQPFTVLRAYSSSEAVASLCWERSKPVIVSESNCTAEAALLGGSVEDSILMPDPLPSVTSSSTSLSMGVPNFRNPSRLGPNKESSSLTLASGGSMSSTLPLPTGEETPSRNFLRQGGTLARLEPHRSSYNFKDDMEVFSPLVDVQPITPSFDKWWDDREGSKKENQWFENKPSSLLYSPSKRFPFADDSNNDHLILNWKSSTPLRQESTPATSAMSDESSITPPEAWGGEKISDSLLHHPQRVSLPSRVSTLTSGSVTSGSMISGLQDLSFSTYRMSTSSLTSTYLTSANLRTEDVSSSQETGLRNSQNGSFSSTSLSLGTKSVIGQGNHESLGLSPLTHHRKYTTYAERVGTPVDVTANTSGSPKTKKTGDETREVMKSWLSRSDTPATSDMGALPQGATLEPLKVPSQPDPQQGTSFTLQLFQRTLEETLASFQSSIHADVRNLHIEILRQFHIQETEMSRVMSSILENQAELMKEVQSLRKENQKLRQLL